MMSPGSASPIDTMVRRYLPSVLATLIARLIEFVQNILSPTQSTAIPLATPNGTERSCTVSEVERRARYRALSVDANYLLSLES